MVRAVDRQVSYFFVVLGLIAFLVPVTLAILSPILIGRQTLLDPLLWTTIVYSLTILILVYERSLAAAREKVLYLAEEVTPLVEKMKEWSLTRRSCEEKLPILLQIRENILPHRRFLFILELVPRTFVRLVHKVHEEVRQVQRELTWLHSAVRADPEGHRVMENREEVSVDEAIYEIVTGRTGVAEDEVVQTITPVFDQHADRLVTIRRLFNSLLDDMPNLNMEWEKYLRVNYVSRRIERPANMDRFAI